MKRCFCSKIKKVENLNISMINNPHDISKITSKNQDKIAQARRLADYQLENYKIDKENYVKMNEYLTASFSSLLIFICTSLFIFGFIKSTKKLKLINWDKMILMLLDLEEK